MGTDIAYCSREDVFAVFPNAALDTLDPATVDAAIKAEAALCDTYFRDFSPNLDGAEGGWVSFESWGSDVRRANAVLAATELMRNRGYNPAAGADLVVEQMRTEKLTWLKDCASGKVVPNIKPRAHEVAGYIQPRVSTSAQRGW